MKPIQLSKFRTTQGSLSLWWSLWRSLWRSLWWCLMLITQLFSAVFLLGWLLFSIPKLAPYSVNNFIDRQSQSVKLLTPAEFSEKQTLTTLHTMASRSQLQSPNQDEEPLFSPLINVVPIDGKTLLVSAANLQRSETIMLSYNFMGPTHYIDAFTEMVYSNTTQSYVGVIEGLDTRTNTNGVFSFSSTDGSDNAINSNSIDFQQVYVPLEDSEVDARSYDGNLELSIVNADTFSADTYIVIVPSYMPPNTLSDEYTLLGAPYSVRASGAISESAAIMLLNMAYDAQLLGGADPHSLALVAWDAKKLRWHEIESKVFIQNQFVSASVTEFTTYALVATSRWQDTFGNFAGLDIGTIDNLDSRSTEDGQELFVADRPGSGSILSKPITPSGDFDIWGKLTFVGTEDSIANSTDNLTNTLLSVDIMSGTSTLLLSNVASGTNLAQLIDPQQHRSLRLRVNLTSTSAATSPSISSWQLSWIPQVPLGDVNCDNLLTPVDALFILQYDVRTRIPKYACSPAHGEFYIPSCDVNNDNKECTSIDALFILQCDVGIANSLCPTDSELIRE